MMFVLAHRNGLELNAPLQQSKETTDGVEE